MSDTTVSLLDADQIDALRGAVVALLDPLLAQSESSGPRDRWRKPMGQAMQAAGRLARQRELAAISGLLGDVADYLGSVRSNGLTMAEIEPWVGALLTYCGATGDAEALENLLAIPAEWPGFDAPFCGARRGVWRDRLQQEAARLGAPVEAPAARHLQLGRDELTLLAGSLEELAGEMGEPLVSRLQAFGMLADSLERFANAITYTGMAALAGLILAFEERLQRALGSDNEPMPPKKLLQWPRRWRAWFIDPSPERLEEALALHRIDGWTVPHLLDAVRRELSHVELVDSRQGATRQRAGAGQHDLSLAVPQDADPEVVDQLMVELPDLIDRLTVAATAIAVGERRMLAEARRVAHTIKGAANTVGITGIATLSHLLEDVLEALERNDSPLTDAHVGLLADGADGLADMFDELVEGQPVAMGADELVGRLRQALGEHDPDGQHESDPSAMDQSDGEAESALTDDDGNGSADAERYPSGPDHGQPADMAAVASGTLSARSAVLAAEALQSANESLAGLARAREVAGTLKRLRRSLRGSDERLQTLAAELERLAISLPGTPGADGQPAEFAPDPDAGVPDPDPDETARFDPLEIERFGSLQSVARRVSEVAADNRQLDQAIAAHLDQLDGQLARLEEIDNTLRETSLRARMVPAGQLATRLQRVCRQAGRAAGRELQLVLDGVDTLVDADLLQALAEPLGHLVRNAVGHGIEDREARLAAGKPLDGRLVVAFAAVPGGLSVRVEDDGRGLDLAGVAKRARALGLLAPDLDIDFQAAAQLVLAPGFSTRERASQLSGRGMGLDVVNQVVRGLRGSISLTGTPGQGLAVCLELPREMSLRSLFIVAAPTHVLALSTRGVQEILPGADTVVTHEHGARLRLGQRWLEVHTLEEALGLPPALFVAGGGDEPRHEVLFVIQTPGGGQAAVRVPDPGPARQGLVREWASYMPRVPGIDGAAILGDGSLAPVLDLPELVSTINGLPNGFQLPAQAADPLPLCLVVDDSISVRKATVQFLADLGFATETAGDGAEALRRVARRRPDLVLVDLEMPQMDGLEMTRALRQLPDCAQIPVIMITSRASARYRPMAMAAGVNHFLAKPFSEDELGALVTGLLG